MQLSISIRSTLLGVLGTLLFLPMMSSAQTLGECNFGRTLDLGVIGEDVQCLQQFLNASGFTIASEGPGSPGNETTKFGSLTEAAVLRWQQDQGISGANGVFGPQSQAAYLLAVVNQLESQMSTATPAPASVAVVTTPTPQVAGASTVSNSAIAAAFLDALEEIELADDEVEHRILTEEPYADHMRALNKAKRAFFQAAEAYFTGQSTEAYNLLDDVVDYAEDAADDSYKESKTKKKNDDDEEDDDKDNTDADKSDAWDAIDDAWDEYQEVKDFIEDADDDGVDVDEATDLLKEATELLLDAEDAADDKEYDEAVELTEEAQDVLDEAQDAARE